MTEFAPLTKFRRSPVFQPIIFIVLLCFSVLSCSGCVSIRVAQIPLKADVEAPSIAMRMYLEKPDADELDNIINGLQSSLYFKNTTGAFVQVATSQNGQWLLKNAPAGTYQIQLDDKFDYDGKEIKLSGSRTKTFRLPAGKRAEIRIILKKTPVGLIVLLSVVIVGLVILAVLSNNDIHKIPLPPAPPLILPPPPIIRPVPMILFFPSVSSRRTVDPPEPPPPTPVFIDNGVYIEPDVHQYHNNGGKG